MEAFTKQNIEEQAYYIWLQDASQTSEECWLKALDYVNWTHIACCNQLSDDFIREFIVKMNIDDIMRHQNLSDEFKRELNDRVDWHKLANYADECYRKAWAAEFDQYH